MGELVALGTLVVGGALGTMLVGNASRSSLEMTVLSFPFDMMVQLKMYIMWKQAF